AVDQHDLVAPVELIRLAWRKAQRNEGIHRRCRAVTLPAPRIAPYRVVTARVAEPAQLLENSDQRQSLAARLRLVRDKQAIKAVLPRTDPRQWLLLALVAKLGRLGSQHLPHDLPRYSQLAADRLDRLPLNKIRPADLRDRLHDQHPKLGPRSSRKPPLTPPSEGSPKKGPRFRGDRRPNGAQTQCWCNLTGP